MIAIIFIALACKYMLGRYEMVWNEHGFMAGIDWLDDHVTLPLQWLLIAACFAGAVLAWLGRWRLALATALMLPVTWVIPKLVSGLYVKPNEISSKRLTSTCTFMPPGTPMGLRASSGSGLRRTRRVGDRIAGCGQSSKSSG